MRRWHLLHRGRGGAVGTAPRACFVRLAHPTKAHSYAQQPGNVCGSCSGKGAVLTLVFRSYTATVLVSSTSASLHLLLFRSRHLRRQANSAAVTHNGLAGTTHQRSLSCKECLEQTRSLLGPDAGLMPLQQPEPCSSCTVEGSRLPVQLWNGAGRKEAANTTACPWPCDTHT